ncbi:MAG: helix-turn-helix transcriptional regulator [Clostridiales bacterium]|nr:helix-turn-helix transcriptional regulator [Clostridiales bacterium]
MEYNLRTRIKELRQERGLTQKQLAEAIKVSVNTISSWELNRSIPTISKIRDMAIFFDVRANYILGLDNRMR